MVVAVIKRNEQILLRKTDPSRNPYQEPWALFGGQIIGDNALSDEMNNDFRKRWDMSVRIVDRLWWDEDVKSDHDGEEKRFIYLDVLAELNQTYEPSPTNPNEVLEWVNIVDLEAYDLNPPTKTVLSKLGYLNS